VSPKRGDRAAPPPLPDEYDVRFADNAAATGWEQLAHHASANLRRAFEKIRSTPRANDQPARHHRMKGTLSSASWKGQVLERWQFEVTAGGRIWYLIDDEDRIAWITYAGTGHPKATD
jgi:hypothetical protein